MVDPPTMALYAGDTLVYTAHLRDGDVAVDFYAWCNTLIRPEPLMLMRDAEQFPGVGVYALYNITDGRVFEYRKVEFRRVQDQISPIRTQRMLDL